MITALQCGRGWGMFWPKNDSITEGGPANGNGLPWILRKYSKNIISENVTKYSIFSVVHVRPNYQTYFSGEGALSGPPKVIKCNSWTAPKAWIDLFSEVNEHLICVSRSFDLAIGCFSPPHYLQIGAWADSPTVQLTFGQLAQNKESFSVLFRSSSLWCLLVAIITTAFMSAAPPLLLPFGISVDVYLNFA